MSSRDSSDAAFDEEIFTSPTYVNLHSSIYEAYKTYDPFYHTHGIFLSAQGDKWDYKSRWEEQHQVSSTEPTGEMLASDPAAALGFSGSISDGYHNVLKAKTRINMNLFPGPDNAGINAVHANLKQFLDEKQYPKEVLVILNDTLDYRISTMHLASKYVSFLELQVPR